MRPTGGQRLEGRNTEGSFMTTTIDIASVRRRTDYLHEDQTEPRPMSDAATERADRAAALERYKALVSSDHDPGTGPAQCPATPVPNPVLFMREGTDADAVDLHDVRQDGIGDCFLMAPLAGLASTPDGRALIKGAITENRNDQGDVLSYTVTLHKPDKSLGRATTFTDVQVTVSGPFVCGHATARQDGNLNEVWPLVVEKAYAQYCGCYPNAGNVSHAMAVLTGRNVTHIGFQWPDRLFGGSYGSEQMASDLAAGKVVVLESKSGIGTNDERAGAHSLYGDHAYVVTGTEIIDGKLCVRLHNPWNQREPDPVPYSELGNWFTSVNIVALK
jgi:hypothetical protein